MRISEILCIPVYISCILASIEHLCLITIRQMTLNASTNLYLQGKLVEDASNINQAVKCSLANAQKYEGQVAEWLVIEIMIFLYFTVTMLIIMAKSRFISVGTDNTTQFEPLYMSYMVKRIVSYIDLSAADSEQVFVEKEKMISV